MIKNVTKTFIKNCHKDSLKYREYIIIDNKEIDIKGILSDTAYKDTTFFGKFNLKMLKFETENDINYKKKEFVYYKEVNGEAIKIGTFIVTEVKDSDTFESVNVTAYDYGLKFANPYTTKLNYSSGKITMFDVVQEICSNCNVELENISLPNGSFIVDSNQFVNGEQFGDVICLIALENGMFATINNVDKLFFTMCNVTITDEIINLITEDGDNLITENNDFIIKDDCEYISDYIELDNKRDTRPITCVLVATSEDLETAGAVRKDQELIKKYGENWLKIYDYGFAYSSDKCEQLIDNIFNQVKGFGYSAFKSNYSFLPYLTLGDIVKLKNKDGNLTKSLILRYETNYDEINLEAPSIISASVEYSLPETTEETAKKALIEANQANSQIVLKANAQGKIVQAKLEANASTGSAFTIDADQVDLNANDVLNVLAGNTINLTSKNITIDSTNFKVDESGNAVMSSATLTNGILKLGNNEIFNTSGVLSLFQYQCSGNEQNIGWYEDYDTTTNTTIYKKKGLQILYNIPVNFTVVSAYVVFTHIPCKNSYNYDSGSGISTSVYDGYARNVKLYKLDNLSSTVYYRYGFQGLPDYSSLPKTEIYGAFGSNGFTGSMSGATSINSLNYKNLNDDLVKGSTQMLLIDTSDSSISDRVDGLQKTAMGTATLFVIGYYKI